MGVQADRGDDFRRVVQNARLIVKTAYELALHRDRPPIGAIFALKNLDPAEWRDERKLQVSGGLAHMDLNRLPDAVVQAIAEGMQPGAALASYLETNRGAVARLQAGEATETTADLVSEEPAE